MRSIVQSTLQKCKKGQQAQQLIGPKLQSDINASTNFWIAIGKPSRLSFHRSHDANMWLLSPYTKSSKSHLGMYNFGHSFTSSLVNTDVAFTKAGNATFCCPKMCKKGNLKFGQIHILSAEQTQHISECKYAAGN